MSEREKVFDIIARLSGRDRSTLQPAMDLVADLGFDSARALELLVELEDHLDILIDVDDVAYLTTVGDILTTVERVSSAAS